MNKNLKPLSLYIHIPFCLKKCNYCDFLSFSVDSETQKQYVQALKQEIMEYGKLNQYYIKSIFIGGGTPTSIDKDLILDIMNTIKENFLIDHQSEITIEANPGTLTEDKLLTYYNAGINRLSMGLQSTDNKVLENLGRLHDYETFVKNYELARKVGFTNINVDLIFGLPGQNLDTWGETLEKVVGLQPEHISPYSLIIEEGTPFYQLYKEGKLNEPNELLERKMYHKTKALLGKSGYSHYEISNFAKKGYESYHNSSYWLLRDYIGIGIGAASYVNDMRYKNTENIDEYIQYSSELDKIMMDIEKLNREDKMAEFMFLGLRMIKGISKKHFINRFNVTIDEIYGDILETLQKEKLIKVTPTRVTLTSKGIDLSNYVFEKFLL